MKCLNNKGFSLVELLAVVSIMGILSFLTIPAISNIIMNSRRTMYADAALTYIRNAKAKVTNKEIDKGLNPDITYYIDIGFLTEDGNPVPSPFGDWVEAYVVYTVSENGSAKYYFLSLDEAGWMIKRKEESRINKNSVVRDQMYEGVDIENIGIRDTIMLVDKDGNMSEIDESKAWTREQTKKCFSFRDLNDKEIELTYFNKECLTEEGGVTIPTKVGGKSVTSIYGYTFYNMGIKSVVLPNSIKTIGDRAFGYNKLTSIKIPSSCKTIRAGAFMYNQLEKVVMTNNVTTIGERAFQSNKIEGYIYSIVPNASCNIGSCAFCYNKVHGASFKFSGQTVTGYIGDFSEFVNKKFVIPATNNEGKPITEIGSSAFYALNLREYEAIIPSTITTIGSSAFNASYLSKVVLPEGLKTIGHAAFYNCKLTELKIPSTVTSIGTLAFNVNSVTSGDDLWIYRRYVKDGRPAIDYSTLIGYSGAKRNNVVIPQSSHGVTLTKLGDSALRYLSLSGSLKIPDSVTSYGPLVFPINYLSSIDQGHGVVTDGIIYKRNSDGTVDKSFIYGYANNNKKNPVIPSGVKTIGSYAFYYSRIQGITIPEGVEVIQNNAFELADFRGKVVLPSTITTLGPNSFYKAKTWTSFNAYMTEIVNKSNKVFDWKKITGGPSAATFSTGTVENWYGDIVISKE